MRQSGLNQVLCPGPTEGVLEQARPGLELELLADVAAVGLDRLCTQAQPFADFMGSQALAHQAKDFKLPVGQLVEQGAVRPPAAGSEDIHDSAGHAFAEVILAPEDLADGLDQLLAAFVLHDVAARAGAKRPLVRLRSEEHTSE